MIRIYGKEELMFTSMGLGSLDETISAVVVEELNGSYEMEMEYPITGRHFDKIQLRNIIFCKPNPYTEEQPFRIYSITKPIDGVITINAEHISYDTNGVVILPKRVEGEIISFGVQDEQDNKQGYFLDTILDDINDSALIPSKNHFTLIKDISKNNVFKEEGYSIPNPMSLRAMLGGNENSILKAFQGEYKFNKFDIYLMNQRGIDRGINIRYGKNMTDLEQEVEGIQLFTGIFPFYSKKYTETYTSTTPVFQSGYIVEDVTPLRSDWLSVQILDPSKGIGGIALTPVVSLMEIISDVGSEIVQRYAPIQVKTLDDPVIGNYYDKVYIFKKNTYGKDELGNLTGEPINLIDCYVKEVDPNNNEIITEISLNEDLSGPINPIYGIIYIIKNQGSMFYNRKFIFDNGSFVEYFSDGFYVEAQDGTGIANLPLIPPIYPVVWNEVTEEWDKDYLDGVIYVRPIKPNVGTVTVDKYVYLDLLTYTENSPELPVILENGIMYINEDLKSLDVQNILSLDLTQDLDDIGGLKPTDMTQEYLFNKAEQYLKDNDFTKVKETVTISFIKLSDSPEYEHLKQLEIVELGDEINIIYEELGVNTKQRVISTEYNVLDNSYNEIELGDKVKSITNNVVTVGDNMSNLKNDTNFADKEYITKLIADNAEIINAEIQNAIIKNLEAANVDISGLLQASSATIDSLVAQMFTTNYAEVAKALIAGSIRVKGDITLDSGSITINKTEELEFIEVYIIDGIFPMTMGWLSLTNGGAALDPTSYDEGTIFKVLTPGYNKDKKFKWNFTLGTYKLVSTYVFSVDRLGNVIANSLIITGGSISIGDNFYVSNDGILTAKGVRVIDGSITINDKFDVDDAGNVKAEAITVKDIYSDNMDAKEINVKDIVVDKIYFLNDKGIYMTRVTENNLESHTHDITRIVSVSGYMMPPGGLTYVRINVNVTTNEDLYYDKTFTVTASYRNKQTNQTYNIDIPVIILAGQSYGENQVDVLVNSLYEYDRVKHISTFPLLYTESITTGGITDKIILNVYGNTYDIVTGIVDQADAISFFAQSDEPDTTDLKNNSLWFDID